MNRSRNILNAKSEMDDDIDVARGNVLVRKASAIQGPARTLSVEIVPGDNGGRRGSICEKKLATKILNAERNDAKNDRNDAKNDIRDSSSHTPAFGTHLSW